MVENHCLNHWMCPSFAKCNYHTLKFDKVAILQLVAFYSLSMYKGLKVITLGPFCASVKELLDMCCSSLLPGGGTNIEFALHCLHEVQGNIMVSLFIIRSVSFIDIRLIRLSYSTLRQHWIYS